MGEEGRIGGEVRNRTKGRSITSKDTAGRRKEKEAWHILSVYDSSFLSLPTSFLPGCYLPRLWQQFRG